MQEPSKVVPFATRFNPLAAGETTPRQRTRSTCDALTGANADAVNCFGS